MGMTGLITYAVRTMKVLSLLFLWVLAEAATNRRPRHVASDNDSDNSWVSEETGSSPIIRSRRRSHHRDYLHDEPDNTFRNLWNTIDEMADDSEPSEYLQDGNSEGSSDEVNDARLSMALLSIGAPEHNHPPALSKTKSGHKRIQCEKKKLRKKRRTDMRELAAQLEHEAADPNYFVASEGSTEYQRDEIVAC